MIGTKRYLKSVGNHGGRFNTGMLQYNVILMSVGGSESLKIVPNSNSTVSASV